MPFENLRLLHRFCIFYSHFVNTKSSSVDRTCTFNTSLVSSSFMGQSISIKYMHHRFLRKLQLKISPGIYAGYCSTNLVFTNDFWGFLHILIYIFRDYFRNPSETSFAIPSEVWPGTLKRARSRDFYRNSWRILRRYLWRILRRSSRKIFRRNFWGNSIRNSWKIRKNRFPEGTLGRTQEEILEKFQKKISWINSKRVPKKNTCWNPSWEILEWIPGGILERNLEETLERIPKGLSVHIMPGGIHWIIPGKSLMESQNKLFKET